jgi:3-phosphoshikimate 1-carboxyvinyltransferase
MGGSLAMACKQRAVCREVVGVARRAETVREAIAMDAVHRATTDLADGVEGADVSRCSQ